ncbi:unnamed protein product [Sphagnum tenellum]
MFESSVSPFGAPSSSSPFAATSAASNPVGTTTNPFGMNQFGTPFGAKTFARPPVCEGQTGTFPFGSGTATGVFGVTQPTTFGASSRGLGASTPSPAFGSGTSLFGSGTASCVFGVTQPPTFGTSLGALGAVTPSPAFQSGTSPFGSGTATSVFGVTQPTTSGASSGGLGASTPSPAFQSGTSLLGSGTATGVFGVTQPTMFGASSRSLGAPTPSPTFRSGTSLLGVGTATSVFGVTQPTPFGASSGGLGASTPSPAFGSGAPVFGQKPASPVRGFGATQPQANIFGSSASGQTQALFSSQPFGSTSPAFGAQSVVPFSSTVAPTFVASPTSTPPDPAPLFCTTPLSGARPAASPFGSQTGSASGTSLKNTFGSGFKSSQVRQQQVSTPAVGSRKLGSSTSAFGESTSGISQLVFPSALGFGTSSPAPGFNTVSPFGRVSLSGNTQASPAGGLVQSSSSQPLGATSAPAFGSTMPVFTNNPFTGSSASISAQIKVAELAQPTPSSAIGAFVPTLAGQAPGAFNLPSFPTAQQGTSIFGDMQALAFGKQNTQNLMSETPVPVTNPFGTLPALTQMPIGKSAGSGPSVQYGISSMPRSEKPTKVQTISLLTPRHITQQSKVHIHARRYHPKKDSPKVSFFSDADEVLTTPKADLMFIPRENPRALFIRQPDQTSLTPRTSKSTTDVRDIAMPVQGNGESGPPESWPAPEKGNPALYAGPMTSTKTSEIFSRDQVSQTNGVFKDQGQRAEGFFSKDGVDSSEFLKNSHARSSAIEALMPKLLHSDYFTEPGIQELAVKEQADPGYSKRVVDFVVGRQGYGVVKFFGVTDVQGLDLESIIQFNYCEVVVYMDESKKPVVGQGLNKPAQVTLLNVKCADKKSGQQYSDGPEVEKFEKHLKKKTEEQGAEFISYSALKGEWKFQVQHFSRYGLDMDLDEEDASQSDQERAHHLSGTE